MTEQTALLLASLSHQWFGPLLLLAVVLGVAKYCVGRMIVRAKVNGQERPGVSVLRTVLGALLAVNIGTVGVAFFHPGCAALVAHRAECMSNLKTLAVATLTYIQDFDERFPPSQRWSEAISSRVVDANKSAMRADGDPFRCPAAESPASYGMNAALSGMSMSKIPAPAETVLLFDADAPVRSFSGGLRDVARERHSGTPNVAMADGHVKHAFGEHLARLTWTPSESAGK